MKFKFTREFYVRPGDRLEASPELGAEVYRSELAGRFYAKAFGGKRAKPDFDYWFRTEEAREKYIQDYLDGLRRSQAFKAKNKAERAAFKHSLEVGDVLVSSWGYDQTNIDWYQVVRVVGKQVVIREIAGKTEATGWLQGTTKPDVGNFVGPERRVLVAAGNSVKVRSFASAYKASPDSTRNWTAYA